MFIEVKDAKKQYGAGEAAVYALDTLLACDKRADIIWPPGQPGRVNSVLLLKLVSLCSSFDVKAGTAAEDGNCALGTHGSPGIGKSGLVLVDVEF